MHHKFIRRKFLRTLLTGILLPLFVCIPALNSFAEAFVHNHSENCYVTTEQICANHEVVNDVFFQDNWCEHCKMSNYGCLAYYYEICPVSDTEKSFIGGSFRCSVCDKYTQSGRRSGQSHIIKKKELNCGLENGATLAEVYVSQNTSEWTKEDVVLTVMVNKLSDKFLLASAPYDFGKGGSESASFTVSGNGDYPVAVTDSCGNCVNINVHVTNIDKEGPKVSLSKSTEEWSESGIKVFIQAEDSLSGLDEDAYSFDGDIFCSSNESTITQNGTVKAFVRDRAGNVTCETIVVSNIGRDPKIVAAEQEAIARENEAKEAALRAEAERKRAEAEAETERLEKEKAKAELERAKAEAKAAEIKAQKEAAQARIIEAEADKLKNETDTNIAESVDDTPDTERVEGIFITVTDLSDTSDKEAVNIKTDEMIEIAHEEAASGAMPKESEQESYTDYYPDIEGDGFSLDESQNTVLANVGDSVLKVGVVSAVLGVLFFSFFNYVYISKDGKNHPVALVRVSVNEKIATVAVPEGKLNRGNRYLIYYSPWTRRKIGKKSIEVTVGKDSRIINTDEGVAFNY